MTAFGQYADDDSASTCKQRDHKDATDLVVTATGPVTHCLKADGFDGSEDGTGRGTPIVPVAFHPTQDPISSTGATHALGTGSKGGCATVAVAFTAGNLARGAGPAPSETTFGTLLSQNGRTRTDQDPLVAVAMINMQGSKGNSVAQADGPSYTLNAMHGHDVHAVAFAQNTRDEVRLVGGDGQVVGALAAQPGMKQTTYLATTDVTGTLSSRSSAAGGLGTDFEVAGGLQAVDIYNGRITGDTTATLTKAMSQTNASGAQVMTPTMQVRRLLPVECERLQGFPDGWTDIYRKKATPDGPRYKSMGNSMAVPVMRFIGTRLDALVKGTL